MRLMERVIDNRGLRFRRKEYFKVGEQKGVESIEQLGLLKQKFVIK